MCMNGRISKAIRKRAELQQQRRIAASEEFDQSGLKKLLSWLLCFIRGERLNGSHSFGALTRSYLFLQSSRTV